MIILLVIIGLSLLIMLHEAGHFFAAKFYKLKVDEFGFGFPPKLFSKKKGETTYSFNLLPFGGFVKIAGESDKILGEQDAVVTEEDRKRMFYTQPAFPRSVIILAGVLMNFLVGWLLLSALFMIGGKPILLISEVQDNSPAQAAGFASGDIVKGFSQSQAFIDYVNANRGNEIEFKVIRGNEEKIIKATPRENTGEGGLGVLIAEAGIPKLGFFAALKEGLVRSYDIAVMTLDAFYNLLKNLFLKASLLEGVVGPVGIFGVAQEAGDIGMIYFFQLLAIISINLAVMNLIPFPALDGGRFFLILVEKVKGSPVSPKTEGIINAVGFIFLILLMVLVTVRDVSRWF